MTDFHTKTRRSGGIQNRSSSAAGGGGPAKVDQICTRLSLKPGMRVLDLCCRPGLHTPELARRGYRVIGADRTEGARLCGPDERPLSSVSLGGLGGPREEAGRAFAPRP